MISASAPASDHLLERSLEIAIASACHDHDRQAERAPGTKHRARQPLVVNKARITRKISNYLRSRNEAHGICQVEWRTADGTSRAGPVGAAPGGIEKCVCQVTQLRKAAG